VKERVYFSLGSNLGDRLGNLKRALDLLSRYCRGLSTSRIYETDPIHYHRQGSFLNLTAVGWVSLPPAVLLGRIKRIEKRLGRIRGRRFGPRIIDIDILLYGRKVIAGPSLVIPHPRMEDRRFVLVPLLELAPTLAHPATGQAFWKSLLTASPGGVYFHACSRYTMPSLLPLHLR
jgi:2-amino-4-hydroxy-6-hydroxymethyldihydropteridine diphosphokinase